MALAIFFLVCIMPFSEVSCLHCWKCHRMTPYPFTAKGLLPSMRAQMSTSVELTSHKKADLWWTEAMPSKYAHNSLSLSERPDLGSGRNAGLLGHSENLLLAWALPRYPCTYCPYFFKEYCFWWTQISGAMTKSDSNGEEALGLIVE